MPTVITFVSPAQRLSRAFNHVGQNSMKIFSSSGSVLCGHQQLEQLTTKLAAARARAKSRDALASVDHHAEFERAVMIRAGQLKEANPDWDRDQCFRVARSQLSPPG
ncbi:hypothetical protein ACVCID_01360 [Burkholderia glumae]